MKKALFIVCGIFFALIAFLLFTGLYLDYPVLALHSPTPFWANFLGFIITAAISLCLFIGAKRA